MSAGDWKQMFDAASKGDLEMVEYYIGTGVDPNYQHPEYMTTALIEAAQNGHAGIVTFLLQHGADATIKADLDGLTALETAKNHNQTAIVKILAEL